MNDRPPMTAAGAERLRGELDRLRSVERPRVIRAIGEAREHGDLRENAEYHAAREEQSFLEGRIAEIESQLARARIIDPASLGAGGRIVFGATVRLIDVETRRGARLPDRGGARSGYCGGAPLGVLALRPRPHRPDTRQRRSPSARRAGSASTKSWASSTVDRSGPGIRVPFRPPGSAPVSGARTAALGRSSSWHVVGSSPGVRTNSSGEPAPRGTGRAPRTSSPSSTNAMAWCDRGARRSTSVPHQGPGASTSGAAGHREWSRSICSPWSRFGAWTSSGATSGTTRRSQPCSTGSAPPARTLCCRISHPIWGA